MELYYCIFKRNEVVSRQHDVCILIILNMSEYAAEIIYRDSKCKKQNLTRTSVDSVPLKQSRSVFDAKIIGYRAESDKGCLYFTILNNVFVMSITSAISFFYDLYYPNQTSIQKS